MKKIHVFTSAACNYLPKIIVLVESIKKWHPEWVVHLALSDENVDIDLLSLSIDEIHFARNLEIPGFDGWAFCHTLVELSTAIKPFVLKKLLDRKDCAAVIYLDPDTVIFSRMEEVISSLADNNLILTPHQITPEHKLDAIIDNEICSLKHGIYNLGFLGVNCNQMGKSFASWWADRLYYFCRDETQHGLFTDQRWIDLVPAFFEGVHIIRSSRFNVAPWNLTTRSVTGKSPHEVYVDSHPLGFYHFTGIDSGSHHIMANKNSEGNRTIYDLVNWYTFTLDELNKKYSYNLIPWAFGIFNDGSKIPIEARVVYRERLDLQKEFPNPFQVSNNGGYKAWWENQGRIEFPNMFNENTHLAITQFKNTLTPGYQGGCKRIKINIDILMFYLKEYAVNSALRKKLSDRIIEVYRTESLLGVKNRFMNTIRSS